MIDTVRLIYLIKVSALKCFWSYPWKKVPLKNQDCRKGYTHIWGYYDYPTGVYVTYYIDYGHRNPSRIKILIKSVPKFTHGNNVMYLSFKDLGRFEEKLNSVFVRAGITETVQLDRLIVEKLDLGINNMFATESEVINVLEAYKRQTSISASYPRRDFPNGSYYRHVFRSEPGRSTAPSSGLLLYNKTKAATRAGLYPGKGILRLELRYPSKRSVERAFWKDLHFLELLDARDIIIQRFDQQLRNAYINEGMSLMSSYSILWKLYNLPSPKRKSRRDIWGLDKMVKANEIFREGVGKEMYFMQQPEDVKKFKTNVLNSLIGSSHAALAYGDDHAYDMFEMFIEEIKAYFNRTSPFCCKTES